MRLLHQQCPGWPAVRLCALYGVARSSLYYRPAPRDEGDLCRAVCAVAGAWPTYGVRRVTRQLRREAVTDGRGRIVGERRVGRLMRRMGLSGGAKPRKRRTTDSDHGFARFANLVADLTVTRPEQVWVADITYVALGRGFVYLAVIMDVFTRCVRGWHLSRNLDAGLSLACLSRALAAGAPQVHHSDQGVQYAATEYVQRLQAAGAAVSMAAVGCPEENGFAERLMRTIKEEHVSLTEYADFADASAQIGRFLDDVYQHKRIHSALGYLTPAEFEARWREEQQ